MVIQQEKDKEKHFMNDEYRWQHKFQESDFASERFSQGYNNLWNRDVQPYMKTFSEIQKESFGVDGKNNIPYNYGRYSGELEYKNDPYFMNDKYSRHYPFSDRIVQEQKWFVHIAPFITNIQIGDVNNDNILEIVASSYAPSNGKTGS